MGKSYKKFPVVRQEKIDKKQYNRKIRHLKSIDVLHGGQYKKLFICDDWHYIWTKKDAINKYIESLELKIYPSTKYNTLEEWLLYWEKCTKRK